MKKGINIFQRYLRLRALHILSFPILLCLKLELWAASHDIGLKYIQLGKPSQNGLVERLNKTLRTECLNLCWLPSMEELNEEIQSWSQVYNHLRPHEILGKKPRSIRKPKTEFLLFRGRGLREGYNSVCKADFQLDTGRFTFLRVTPI